MEEREHLSSIERKVSLYLKVQKYPAAHDLIRHSKLLFPHAANLDLLQGIVYHRQSKLPEAVKAFGEALVKNPEYLEAAIHLALILSDVGQYDEAAEVFETIKKLTGRPGQIPKVLRGKIANSHAENGRNYEKAGLFQEAAQEYQKALALYEKMPDIKIRLAKIYMKSNQPTKAYRELTEALDFHPVNAQAMTLLGILSYRSGKNQSALDYFKKAQHHAKHDRLLATYLRLAGSQASQSA